MTSLNEEQINKLLGDIIKLVNSDENFIEYCEKLVPKGTKRVGEFYIKDIDYVIAIVFDNTAKPRFEIKDVDEIDRADVMIILKSEVIDLLIRGLTFEDALFYGMITPVGKYWLRDAIVFKEMFTYYAKNKQAPEVNAIINKYFAIKGGDSRDRQ